MSPSKLRRALAFVLGILLIGGLMELAGYFKGDNLVFPGVLHILRAFVRLLASPQTYLQALTTLRHLIISLALAALIGTVLGLIEGASDFVLHMLRPLMTLMRSIPVIVLVVVVMVLMKYERVPIAAPTIVLIPIISEATQAGYRSIPRELIDVYRLNGGFSLFVLTRVHLPMMAGYTRQAYENAVGMGIKMVVTSEYLVQTHMSLGKAVFNSSYFNEYEDIYAYALVMILLVIAVSAIPSLIAKCARVISNWRD